MAAQGAADAAARARQPRAGDGAQVAAGGPVGDRVVAPLDLDDGFGRAVLLYSGHANSEAGADVSMEPARKSVGTASVSGPRGKLLIGRAENGASAIAHLSDGSSSAASCTPAPPIDHPITRPWRRRAAR